MLYSHYANPGQSPMVNPDMSQVGKTRLKYELDSSGLPEMPIRALHTIGSCVQFLALIAKHTTDRNKMIADIRVRALAQAIKGLYAQAQIKARRRWEAMQTRKLLQGSAPTPDPPAPKRTRVKGDDAGKEGVNGGGI